MDFTSYMRSDYEGELIQPEHFQQFFCKIIFLLGLVVPGPDRSVLGTVRETLTQGLTLSSGPHRPQVDNLDV